MCSVLWLLSADNFFFVRLKTSRFMFMFKATKGCAAWTWIQSISFSVLCRPNWKEESRQPKDRRDNRMNKSDIFGHCIIFHEIENETNKNSIALQISQCIRNIFRRKKHKNPIQLNYLVQNHFKALAYFVFGFFFLVFSSNKFYVFFSPFYVLSFGNDSKWNGIHHSGLGTKWIFMVRLTPAVDACSN